MKFFVSTLALAAAQTEPRGFTDSLGDVGLNAILSNYDLGAYGAYDGAYYDDGFAAYDNTYDYTSISAEGSTDGFSAYEDVEGDASADPFADYQSGFETYDYNTVEETDAPVEIPVAAPVATAVVSEKEKVRPGQSDNAQEETRGMGAGASMGGGDGNGAYKYCPRLTGQSFTVAMAQVNSATITDPTKFDDCDKDFDGTQLNNQVCQYTVRQVKGSLLVWSGCSTVATCRSNMGQNYDQNMPSLSQCRDTSQTANARFHRPSVCNFCGKLSKDATRNNVFSSATALNVGGSPKEFYALAANGADSFGDVRFTTYEEETGSDSLLGVIFAGQTYA